jgi:hypothetical protein
MNWSRPLGEYDYDYYKHIKNFTLIKETPKAVYLKLENDINLWFPKKCVKSFNVKSKHAWVWEKIYKINMSKYLSDKKKKEAKLLKGLNNEME